MCPQVASSNNVFLREKNGNLYIVTRTGRGGHRKESWRRVEGAEKEVLEKILAGKQDLQEEIVEFPCMNPECTNTIKMSKSQLDDFFISYKKKYDMIVFPCCSKECQEKMLEKHGGRLQD